MRPRDFPLPNNSMTAPTLELKSSRISLRQLQSTANTRLSSSGNCATRWPATGSRQDAATERTSSSLSPSLEVHEREPWEAGGGTHPSTAASTTSFRIALLRGPESPWVSFVRTRSLRTATSYFIPRRPACRTSHTWVLSRRIPSFLTVVGRALGGAASENSCRII
jgi:hypothetical protein